MLEPKVRIAIECYRKLNEALLKSGLLELELNKQVAAMTTEEFKQYATLTSSLPR